MHLVFDPPAPLWHYFPFSSDVELYLRPLTFRQSVFCDLFLKVNPVHEMEAFNPTIPRVEPTRFDIIQYIRVNSVH